MPQATAVPTEVENPEYAFYCPSSPFEKIAVTGRVRRVAFRFGELTTTDPDIAEAIRGSREFGSRYFEADLAVPVPCPDCGQPFRHMRSLGEHIKKHAPRD